MKEEYLHFIWRQKLLSKYQLFTQNKKSLTIIDPGQWNSNSGPDFLQAKIKIDETIWVGHVEIHINASDWFAHHHEDDPNYDTVILHVVLNHNCDVYSPDNRPIPVLQVDQYLDEYTFKIYQNFQRNQLWIPCQNEIKNIDSFHLSHWLERLFIERLESKSKLIHQLLMQENYNFEYVFFISLARSFGLKNNADSFLELALSVDFLWIQKLNSDRFRLEALLFGLAGFLEVAQDEPYQNELRHEYQFLKHKFKIETFSFPKFQFFRMRPQSFPTLRIAQLTGLYASKQNLFSNLMHAKSFKEVKSILQYPISDFWRTHFTFSTKSKESDRRLSNHLIQLFVLNTILPMKLAYLGYSKKPFSEELFEMVREMASEKNNLITNFHNVGVVARDALESQALIELKNNYCAKKRCLQCAIGVKLLKR